jgi:hypothetical protein
VEFESAFDAGALRFPRCNVRGIGRVHEGAVEYVVTKAVATEGVQPISESAFASYLLQQSCGRGNGCIIACPLAHLCAHVFADLCVGSAACAKALVFLQGLDCSQTSPKGSYRRVTTPVKCIFDDAPDVVDQAQYSLVSITNELMGECDFGTGRAVALISHIECTDEDFVMYELVAEYVAVVPADDVTETRNALRLQNRASLMLPCKLAAATPPKHVVIRAFMPPVCVKRCRAVALYPSDCEDL